MTWPEGYPPPDVIRERLAALKRRKADEAAARAARRECEAKPAARKPRPPAARKLRPRRGDFSERQLHRWRDATFRKYADEALADSDCPLVRRLTPGAEYCAASRN